MTLYSLPHDVQDKAQSPFRSLQASRGRAAHPIPLSSLTLQFHLPVGSSNSPASSLLEGLCTSCLPIQNAFSLPSMIGSSSSSQVTFPHRGRPSPRAPPSCQKTAFISRTLFFVFILLFSVSPLDNQLLQTGSLSVSLTVVFKGPALGKVGRFTQP